MKSVKMEIFEEMLDSVLWSGWVKGHRPVNMILIALPEHYKTQLLEKYRYCNGVLYMSDCTARGLQDEISHFYNNKKPLNHIIIPDFLSILSRQQSSVKMMLQFLNSLVYDGTAPIRTGFTDFKIEFQCGLITSITTAKFFEKSKLWENIGFVSRVVPVSYQYSIPTKIEISKQIMKSAIDNENLKIEKRTLQFPEVKREVSIDEKLAEEIRFLSLCLPSTFFRESKNNVRKDSVLGFRLEENLFSLVKGEALKNNRTEVSSDDVEKVKFYSNYINFRSNVI